jgi:hypothetical protein
VSDLVLICRATSTRLCTQQSFGLMQGFGNRATDTWGSWSAQALPIMLHNVRLLHMYVVPDPPLALKGDADQCAPAALCECPGPFAGVHSSHFSPDLCRDAIEAGEPIEGAFSRNRSFRKKLKKYGQYVPRGQAGPQH